MKLKFCFCVLFLLIVNIVESQTHYKNRLAGKIFVQIKDYYGPSSVYLFKDSTYYEFADNFMGTSYTFGSYQYISKDTVIIQSKYANSIDSNQQINEYKTDTCINIFKISNIHPCSLNQTINVSLYKGDEELYAWENVKFSKSIELSSDSLIKFDNIVFRLNNSYRIDYNLKDPQNNVIELHYDLPNDGYSFENLTLIKKGNGFYIQIQERNIFFKLLKGKKVLQDFLKYFPEPCYLINY